MAEEIVNRVANSGLITIDLEDLIASENNMIIDIKDQLWQGIALREADFRQFIKEHNWEQYKGKNVGITCSVEAIIPQWAYVLIASKLASLASEIVFGDEQVLKEELLSIKINQLNMEAYQDAKVVIKGCSDVKISSNAYVQITKRLIPFAKSIMYGEPCSTVPIWKRPRV